MRRCCHDNNLFINSMMRHIVKKSRVVDHFVLIVNFDKEIGYNLSMSQPTSLSFSSARFSFLFERSFFSRFAAVAWLLLGAVSAWVGSSLCRRLPVGLLAGVFGGVLWLVCLFLCLPSFCLLCPVLASRLRVLRLLMPSGALCGTLLVLLLAISLPLSGRLVSVPL